jgi:hypothetical protein
MPTYRVRVNAYNDWHPEYGCVQVVLRVNGRCLDDAMRTLTNGIVMTSDGRTVMASRENHKGLGPTAIGFPSWSLACRPRIVTGDRPAYVAEHVAAHPHYRRTIASIAR